MKRIACIFLMILALKFNPSQSQSFTCNTYDFKSSNMANKSLDTRFKSCVDLPVLSSYLHWTYDPANETLRIAYRHTGVGPTSSKWVVWAINPIQKGMVGSQCLVAYHDPKDGSMVVYTSSISSYGTQLAKEELSFKVSELSALGLKDEIIIFAMLEVRRNKTTINQIWQEGPLSSDGTPLAHSISGPNVRSVASLDLLSGIADIVGIDSIATSLKYTHGILNAISWGILMPSGVIIARYMRVFPSADPAWFYLHITCQMTAYALGVAGWGTGLKLGSLSKGIEHSLHRNIGITLFILATLQMFALLLRPKKDHKYRTYWNIYHHSIGYTTIILSIVNVMQGFQIINHSNHFWKKTYIGVIVALAFIAAFLEGFTWYTLFRRKDAEPADYDNKP